MRLILASSTFARNASVDWSAQWFPSMDSGDLNGANTVPPDFSRDY